jgi:alpha-tubulin suppressor-like RCC1 family protein
MRQTSFAQAFLRAIFLFSLLVVAVTNVQAGRISAGAYNGYAVDNTGAVWIWGANLYGQLCDGSLTHRGSAGKLSGLSDVVTVSAGGAHALTLKTDASAAAWGLNSLDSSLRGGGQVGDGTYVNRGTPVAVSKLSGAQQVVAGQYHSLAVLSDATVRAWGFNDAGQLGDGTKITRNEPVGVVGLGDVSAVSAGCDHSVALKTDGSVWSWGFNSTGQLGDGSNQDKSTPVRVAGLTDVVAVAAGCAHSMALKSDGTVWAWGFNFDGELGGASPSLVRNTPAMIPTLGSVTAIAAGGFHSLALKTDGTVWAWGKNNMGQVGDNSTLNRNAPNKVNVKQATEVAAGFDFSLVLGYDGSISAWGNNNYGQLGVGTTSGNYLSAATVLDASGAPLSIAPRYPLQANWNLLGNSNNAPLAVSSVFGDANQVVAVWKWVGSRNTWAFYSPTQVDGGAAYAATMGFEFLTRIEAGDGFWVQTKTAFEVQLPTAAAVPLSSLRSKAGKWTLNALGDSATPNAIGNLMAALVSAAGGKDTDPISVWAWNEPLAKWYFFSPSLYRDGSLAAHIQSNGYLDFVASNKSLSPGTGFWINRP